MSTTAAAPDASTAGVPETLSAGRPPTFYTNLVTCPLTRVRGSRRLTLTALLALTQLATATGYWRERLRE
jgi:hypothetical protein